MQKATIWMGVTALFLALLAFWQGGLGRVAEGLLQGGKMLIQVLPLMLFAFASAGLISSQISEKTVSRWLGKEAGLKGIFLGALAGALVPGGPYVFFPLAATLLVSGAEIGVVFAFIAAKSLWTLSRMPMEVALIGPKIAFIRYLITFPLPILIGIAANAFFSGFTEKIRAEIKKLQGTKKA